MWVWVWVRKEAHYTHPMYDFALVAEQLATTWEPIVDEKLSYPVRHMTDEYNSVVNPFLPVMQGKIVQIIQIERIQNTTGLITRDFEINLIHFSAVPWIDFTSYSHARSFTFPDSCPKISFGKMMEENGKKTMQMSVHVHHGLVDGYDVGLFISAFEELMNA